ncbi:replication factor C large subunit [Candidatus Woesearchaeota archaeon]|nr:MAG: replication factor C large subunit [Candidatus Woesearchaeota archaeon]
MCFFFFLMLWTHKYAPKVAEIPQDTSPLLNFVRDFKKQKKKAVLLHGPSGSGKTAAVVAIAKEFGLELVEVNASDFRSADEIHAKVGQALKQYSLFGSGKLILVDEVDGIAGNQDRGGVGALVDLVKDAAFPLILVANDPYNQKLSSLRSKCVLVEFPAVPALKLADVLKRIVHSERLVASDDVLKALARRSGGDIRGAIIDAQVLSAQGFDVAALNSLHERQREESMMQALIKILKSTDPQVALSAFDSVGEDIDECMLWVDENMPREYAGRDLARAMECLSRADVFKGRIKRWQYWRFLAYVNVLMTAGVAVAKDKKSGQFVQYQRTQRILKRWMANQKYAKRKEVSLKLGRVMHCSGKKALLPVGLLQRVYQAGHPSAAKISEELSLSEEEAEWLAKV